MNVSMTEVLVRSGKPVLQSRHSIVWRGRKFVWYRPWKMLPATDVESQCSLNLADELETALLNTAKKDTT